MNDLLRSFVRALANVFHPRMLWLTLMPFGVATVVWGALLWYFWQTLTGTASGWLDGWALTSAMYRLFDAVGFSSLHAVIAPFLVVIMTIPLIVLTVLLLIATLSMPGVIKLLTRRPKGHYAMLEERRGGSWYGSLGHSVLTTIVCLVALVVTLPLWLIPPFFALIPPLLWGWLTYRVMTYDALAVHASAEERRLIVRNSRWPLLGIGIVSGLLSSVPTMLWAWSVWLLPLFPVVAAVTIWAYAFILVFSALWFAHYCLHALERLRANEPHYPAISAQPETVSRITE
ncbi:EI24 domain-containing protein [Caballeronia sp. LZ025]|uniref:EI24 domain-containing protein n=1 Tax=Caballeronia TaxID=1827195 RepID=UPI001FCFAF7C|nr:MULTISPECIES: EI24 domain-containing protein [Caballeronia]MDR5731591.1 EI24 domain-containing protein [Caballeronia sp. LZ025]